MLTSNSPILGKELREYISIYSARGNSIKSKKTFQIQIICRDYNRAMKTAMRLIEYEKELQTKDVYSLVALACYFNECYKDCSKAFVKLERLPDITDKERESYEMLAINLFSRHPPIDKPKKEFNCPKKDCKARITE